MQVSSDRIRERLRKLGKNPSGAALEAGLTKDSIRNILRGRSVNVRTDTMMALAAVLDCTVEYLMGIEEDPGQAHPGSVLPRREPKLEMLPVKHEVGTGYWRQGSAELTGQWGPVSPHPRYPDAPQWLERVMGLGAADKFAADDLVHVVEPTGYQPLLGDYVVVVQVKGGLSERSIRHVVAGRGHALCLVCPTTAPGFKDALELGVADCRVIGKIVGRYSPMD